MEFKLPDIGEGVQEGELIRWLVKEGDAVQSDQSLLEVMTDKATVEVPSPVAGTIKSLKAKDGDMIKVGQLLADITEGASATKAATRFPRRQWRLLRPPRRQWRLLRPPHLRPHQKLHRLPLFQARPIRARSTKAFRHRRFPLHRSCAPWLRRWAST